MCSDKFSLKHALHFRASCKKGDIKAQLYCTKTLKYLNVIMETHWKTKIYHKLFSCLHLCMEAYVKPQAILKIIGRRVQQFRIGSSSVSNGTVFWLYHSPTTHLAEFYHHCWLPILTSHTTLSSQMFQIERLAIRIQTHLTVFTCIFTIYFHSLLPDISIASLQVHYYSEALMTTASIAYHAGVNTLKR